MGDIDYVEEVIDSLIVGGADQLQVIISKRIWRFNKLPLPQMKLSTSKITLLELVAPVVS